MNDSDDATSQEAAAPKSIIAMVALNDRVMPPVDAIVKDLTTRHPTAEFTDAGTSEHGSQIFHLNGNVAALALMPAPIPWGSLEGPCATAWWWDEAEDKMRNHVAHLLVMLAGAEGSTLTRHIDVTHLVCAVANQADAAGIYWGTGTLVHESSAFADEAIDMAPDAVPLHLWIDLRIEPIGPKTYRFFTTGMSEFNQLEIEIDETKIDPDELFDICHNILHYIVTGDVQMNDGETIGRSETEKILVQKRPSMFPRQGDVLKLVMPS